MTMYKKPLFSFLNLSIILLIGSLFVLLVISCSDTIDKSPVSSIPDSDIPTDITPVSSGGNGLHIKGGTIERYRVNLYLRFETDKYKDQDIWIRLSSSDSSYTFEEILNREPNNFIKDVTYKYSIDNLSSNTEYNAWMVWQHFSEVEQVGVTFTTLSQ